nr:hypothetical protein [Desulfofundulus salinum]
MAGVLPGILLGGVLLITSIIYARMKNYDSSSYRHCQET